MNKMIDMSIVKDNSKKEEDEVAYPGEDDKYPYGLRIRLDEKDLEKLGITTLPKIGEYLNIEAVADVVEVSERQMANEKESRGLSLQITKLCIGHKKKNAAETMYGKKEES